MNLYDLTRGNYRVMRAVSYPEYPESLVVFDAQVAATGETEGDTSIFINGKYTGPTDVVASENYELTWAVDGPKLLESGSATLVLRSGNSIRQTWSSIISPRDSSNEVETSFHRFPSVGEVINATISPFKIDCNSMTYEWEGTVKKLSE